jgi:16S rRNA (guanine1207-N2)-methyltransferase
LAAVPTGAIQLSPLELGAQALEDLTTGSLEGLVICAPPGVLDRRYVLAQGARVVEGGAMIALAPKAKGGARLAGELAGFGFQVAERAKAHHRICQVRGRGDSAALTAAIAAGARQYLPELGLWSQPGLFSWDRVDRGTALLLSQPWTPSGAGVDLGCGIGLLAKAVLGAPSVAALTLMDIDRRAIAVARLNIDDPRVGFLQHDLRHPPSEVSALDFAIMNPPFHDGGVEDRRLGQAFIDTAARMLRPGGVLRMVANVGLPYESALARSFAQVTRLTQESGFKVLEARR